MTEQRPTAPAPIVGNIPLELTERPQWVCWAFEWRGNKWTKVPYTPHTTDRAKTNAPSTWRSFEAALSCYEARSDFFDGIGYVFSKDDPYIGGDIDHCIDESSQLSDFARQYLPFTYAEISPSGGGVKFIARAKGTYGRKTTNGELYSSGRFFTITGNVLTGRDLISNCQAHIEAYADALGMDKKRATEGTPSHGDRADSVALIPSEEWAAGRILVKKGINRLLGRLHASAVSRKTGEADTQLGYLLREDYEGFNTRWPYACILRGDGSADDSQVRAILANSIRMRGFTFPEYAALMSHFFAAAAHAKWGTVERWREELAFLWLRSRAPRSDDPTEPAPPIPPAKGRAGDHAALLERAYQVILTYRVGINSILTVQDLANGLAVHKRTASRMLHDLSKTHRISYEQLGPYGILVSFPGMIYSEIEKGGLEHTNGLEGHIPPQPMSAEHKNGYEKPGMIYSEIEERDLPYPDALDGPMPISDISADADPDLGMIYSPENEPVYPDSDAEIEKADERGDVAPIDLESRLSQTVLLPAATIIPRYRVSLEQAVGDAFENLPRDRLIDAGTGERKRWAVTNQRVLEFVEGEYPDQHWQPAAITYWIKRVRKRRDAQRFDELRGMRKAELDARLTAAAKKIEEAERKAAEAAMPEIREYHQKRIAQLANYQSLLAWERSEREHKEAERVEQHGYSLAEQRDMLEVVERSIDAGSLIARLHARKQSDA